MNCFKILNYRYIVQNLRYIVQKTNPIAVILCRDYRYIVQNLRYIVQRFLSRKSRGRSYEIFMRSKRSHEM
jgi:hypothetical protein